MLNTLGTPVNNNEYDKRVLAPWLRANEYIRIFGEKRMKPEELADFRKECEKLRIVDQTGRNNQGLVDVDSFLEKIVIKYRIMVSKERDLWHAMFKSADLDGKGKMTYKEFVSLFKLIEQDRFDDKKIEDIFTSNCDMIENEEIALSYSKFLAVCYEFELFSESKQNQCLGLANSNGVDKAYSDFVEGWKENKKRLNDQISSFKGLVPDELVNVWVQGLSSLDEM